jgi:multicomponent Na+:H+ antiporter subunit E
MSRFLLNLLLALAWGALTGQLTTSNLIVGFLLGYVLLGMTQGTMGPSTYFEKVRRTLFFAIFFLWELFKANLRVTYEIVTPPHLMRPGVVAIPLDVHTDIQITLLANLITLTPGTLSLDVSHDRRVLFVHGMYIDDPDKFRREIKEGFERRVLEVTA